MMGCGTIARTTQNPVPARACGFNSRPRYQQSLLRLTTHSRSRSPEPSQGDCVRLRGNLRGSHLDTRMTCVDRPPGSPPRKGLATDAYKNVRSPRRPCPREEFLKIRTALRPLTVQAREPNRNPLRYYRERAKR